MARLVKQAGEGERSISRKGADEFVRRLYIVLWIRLLLGLIFFSLVALSRFGHGDFESEYPITAFYVFSILLLGFTVVGGATFRLFSHEKLSVYAAFQIGFDIAAVSIFVCLSGGGHSPFVVFYIPVILLSALLFGVRGSMWTAVSTSLIYGAIILVQIRYGFHDIFPDEYETVRFDYTHFFSSFVVHGATLCIVAIVAGFLVEKWQNAESLVTSYINRIALIRKLHHQIVEYIPSGVFLAGNDGRIIYANKTACSILEKAREDLRGRNLGDFFPDLKKHWIDLMKRGQHDVVRREIAYRDSSGRDKTIGFSLCSAMEDGNMPRLLMIFQDITAVKRAEQDIRAMEDVRLVATAASEIAHNVKNPLGAISGAAQMLKQELINGGNTELCKRLTSMIIRESERLDDAIRTLLHVSRSTLKIPNLQELDVGEELKRILGVFSGKVRDCLISCNDCENITIYMDRSHFEVIIWTLLENADDAMPNGGRIDVIVQQSHDGKWVDISVRDDGPGVPPDIQPHLFHPFFTTKPRGTGLGLSIARQLARRVGGTLEYVPLEKGGCFFVQLPILKDHERLQCISEAIYKGEQSEINT